jgi:transcriptional regulator with XRE-family HTH domain
LRAWRVSQKITQRQVAELCGVTESLLSRYESGTRTPTAAMKLRMARGLGVPIATLFDPPDPGPPNGGRRG